MKIFKNKAVQMRVVDDNTWHGPVEEEPGRHFDYGRRAHIKTSAAESLIKDTAKYTAGALIAYKTATTFLRMAEHLVVTKI